MTSDRIVIHRDWTFTYDGRKFSISGSHGTDSRNQGYGYEVSDERGRQIRDGYMTMDEIRAEFPGDYAYWIEQGEPMDTGYFRHREES